MRAEDPMQRIVIGTFLGFVLGAAFLAACGSDGSDGGAVVPPPATVSGAVRWTPLGATTLIGTGVDLDAGEVWASSAIYENAGTTRHQYGAFEIRANGTSGAAAQVDVGVLPALDGSNFATEPQWLGTVSIRPGDNRRATLTDVRLPPTRSRMALRANGGSVRILTFSVAPYDAQLP